MTKYICTDKFFARLVVVTLINIGIATGSMAASSVTNAHDHQDIMDQTKAFLEANLQLDSNLATITVKPLDQRLRLHACNQPLVLFWPPGAQKIGHTSIGVRCEDHKPWKIFIGTHIQQFTDVWVTTVAIARGTLIEDHQVKLTRKDVSKSITQYISSAESPVGLVSKRPLRVGDVLQTAALAKQKVVKRGDRVHVIGRKNGLEIRTSATALMDGAAGDRIRVRSISTKKELEGILRKNSTVYVNI